MTDVAKALDVLRIIFRHSHDNPVKGEAIEELTGVNPRYVAEIAVEAQKRGFAVCSCSQGYFMARTKQEFENHLEKEHQRAMAILQKETDAKKNFIDQITLFEPEAA